MNQLQGIQSGSGFLKNAYDSGVSSPVTIALKRRKAKMEDKITVPDKDEAEGNEVPSDEGS